MSIFLLDVCGALRRSGVNYAIAGGVAVALHGAVRGTVDIDLVVALDVKNLRRIEEALGTLRLSSRLPIHAEDLVNFRQEYIEKRNLIAWSFVDSNDPRKLVDIIITENIADLDLVSVEVDGRRLPVLSKQSLIEMKLRSGRPQDLADIEMLGLLNK